MRLPWYDKAIEYYNQALTITRKIGDQQGEGSNLNGLGNAYLSLGQYDKAIKCYNQMLTIAQKIGGRRDEGTDLNNLGIAYLMLGQYDKVIKYHEVSWFYFYDKFVYSLYVAEILDI